ncbi:hypothetical protein DSO57_1003553 [Entomophthora muscae]|uniref:Uncharacterized protein n=1 Tax=Entomophthora muscae TaxID=34485 RepID=A0ACC2RZQ9_9FUNG|nr:hypothetical protein DSO57_1003553 [Entomophthora muscae]
MVGIMGESVISSLIRGLDTSGERNSQAVEEPANIVVKGITKGLAAPCAAKGHNFSTKITPPTNVSHDTQGALDESSHDVKNSMG